ncbi:hypothetical protein HMPREF1633_09055 [Tissierellia bacterium S5-A11]|nr:hypothetical protein HMPREF1633_09055 [Tissierellia bacterium S5-A11]
MTESYTILNLPEEERPREKLLTYGADRLSNVELIAILLGSGTQKESALRLAEKILTKCQDMEALDSKAVSGLSRLSRISLKSLKEIKGVGDAKAASILAAMELAKRVSFSQEPMKYKLNSPLKVADFVLGQMSWASVEEFVLLCLNTKKELISVHRMTKGTINYTVVHPRDVFKHCLDCGAHSVILVHNHPSGDVTPSQEDIHLTQRLKQVGDLVGIPVVDHLIVGGKRYYSFLEEGKLVD